MRKALRRVVAFAMRYGKGYLAPILLHRAIDFPLGIAIALGIALVVLFLSLRQTDLAFDAATLIMQIQRQQRIPGTFNFADQSFDFFGFQQQLSGADRVRADVGGRGW